MPKSRFPSDSAYKDYLQGRMIRTILGARKQISALKIIVGLAIDMFASVTVLGGASCPNTTAVFALLQVMRTGITSRALDPMNYSV